MAPRKNCSVPFRNRARAATTIVILYNSSLLWGFKVFGQLSKKNLNKYRLGYAFAVAIAKFVLINKKMLFK